MYTGLRNPPQLPEDEQCDSLLTQLNSRKLIQDQNNLLFRALNFSNDFATIDFEARVNTKIDYSNNHVLKTIIAAELNTLHRFAL